MNNKLIRAIGAAVLVAMWAALTGFAWFAPAKDVSEAERRPLDQMPEITWESIVDGKFMPDFESYTLDQFPLRDTFRQIKSLFHYYAMQQSDNNDIYVSDGYAAKLEYPLNKDSVDYAVKKFSFVYDKYLKDTGSRVFMAIVPDKGYYLTQENGYLAMDYDAMYAGFREGMPFAQQIDLRDTLTAESYYRTDTHWRQEKLLAAAEKICHAMGVSPFAAESFTQTAIQRPFYGVYYGQAALPMESETMYLMQSDLLADCRVYLYTDDRYTQVYEMEKLNAKDPYDVFLSGAQSLVRIENPNCQSGRELVIFRDSFGSSLAPLLVQDYSAVTLIDIRYIQPQLLERYVEFEGKDILFMYSSLVLNKNLI